MVSLTDDAAALIEALNVAPCHFAGLSMGGFVGLRLALRRPELLRSLILLNTSADPDPVPTRAKNMLLGLIGRSLGFASVVGQAMPILFGRSFMNDPDRADMREFWRQQILSVDRRGCFRTLLSAIVRREGIANQLPRIHTPALVIAGEEDASFAPQQVRKIAEGIPKAEFVCIPRAGHSSVVERPDAIAQAIGSFLTRVAATPPVKV